MNNKLNVLLTGASGTIGLEVLKQLYQQRHRFNITVFDIRSKNTLKTFAFCKKNIEIVYGDISNNYDTRKACFDKDYVIHLAAIIPPLADENPSYAFKVNTLGTENLIKNLEQLSPLAFLLYSSSISVYGDRLENPLINVEDPFNPSEGDEYAKTKIKAEHIIYSCNLDWSIFRLTAIMGNHKLSKLMFHMPLETSLEIATPEDTARAFVHAIDDRFLISKKIFNLGGGYSCRTTYKEFLIRSFKILGLGDLDFPQKAFADKNFHCGFYEDSDELEKILHFRKDSIEDYFDNLIRTNPFWKKILTSIFKKQIKKELLKNSEPFLAFNTIDTKLINHFFKI